jgi:hypothetical protein
MLKPQIMMKPRGPTDDGYDGRGKREAIEKRTAAGKKPPTPPRLM